MRRCFPDGTTLAESAGVLSPGKKTWTSRSVTSATEKENISNYYVRDRRRTHEVFTMLLIAPPERKFSSSTSWHPSEISRQFSRFCRRYEQAVLELPYQTQARVLRYLTRGFHGLPLTGHRLHSIVERELTEQEYEFSGKVTRLILLQAFVQSLQDEGMPLEKRTVRLLIDCARSVPRILALAVDDHLGRISA